MDAGPLIESLGPGVRRIALADGDVLVRQGDQADEVYAVNTGELEASISSTYGDIAVGCVEAGEVVGEITVIAGGRRTATLRANGPTEVWVIPRADFEQWMSSNPDAADVVSAEARDRIDRSQVAAMLTDLLGARDPELVEEIASRVEWRRVGAGDLLFREGEMSDAAYFIVGGRLIVTQLDEDGNDVRIGEVGRGDVVGEVGLLDDAPRSATIRAVRDSTLATLRTETFEELVMRSPALMLHVARGIIGRLKFQRRAGGRASSLTIAVTSSAVPEQFAEQVAAEVGRFGSVRHLSSARVDQYLNRPDIAQAEADNVGVPRLSEFMHEADVGNECVILETDRDMTSWTRRVLRQADRVLVAVSARPDPTEHQRIRAIVDQLDGLGHVRRMLGVFHPVGSIRPRDTARLVNTYGFDEVVHLRAGSSDDVARVARLASGNGVGLVLSGGGARGFAHLGAVKAFREAGVPIDAVAGCSMGAPLAAGVALDLPDDELLALAEAQFHRLLDYTVPVVALLKGQRISRNIEATFASYDIEDLWLPFYCVSTNITRSRLEVHRRGAVAQAVRASVAIPGVLPPVPVDGDLLVDGGVLDNLPVEAMRSDPCIGTVVAVDVAPQQGPRAKSDYGTSVSGFRALRAHVGKAPTTYPGVTSVLLRSMLTGAVVNRQTAMRGGVIDLLVQLNLPGVGLLDFERVREVASQGYDDARPQIDEWARSQSWIGVA